VATGLGDDHERPLGRVRVAAQQVCAHTRLYRDQRHAVRDHVMEFPRDPQPLFHDRLPGRGLGPGFGGGQQVTLMGAPLPHRVTDRDHRDEDGHARDDVYHREIRDARALQRDERHHDEDQADDGLTTGAVHGHRIQGQHGQIRQHTGEVPTARHDKGGHRDHRQPQQRSPPPQPNAGGSQRGEHDSDRRRRVQGRVDRVDIGADQNRDGQHGREHRQGGVDPVGRAPCRQGQHADLRPGHGANRTDR
jgi:hypothetical protein